MKKETITTALLCLAIGLMAIGVHINNLPFIFIGGFICGVYNTFINEKD